MVPWTLWSRSEHHFDMLRPASTFLCLLAGGKASNRVSRLSLAVAALNV